MGGQGSRMSREAVEILNRSDAVRVFSFSLRW